jgi:hypothetical protein
MNRRTFIHATALAVIGQPGFTEMDRSVAALIELLEESPRETLVRELVRRVRGGLRYEELLAALSLATVRNVQPYPDVGYKYHSVMVLRSINATTEHLSSGDKWLPIIWAAD